MHLCGVQNGTIDRVLDFSSAVPKSSEPAVLDLKGGNQIGEFMRALWVRAADAVLDDGWHILWSFRHSEVRWHEHQLIGNRQWLGALKASPNAIYSPHIGHQFCQSQRQHGPSQIKIAYACLLLLPPHKPDGRERGDDGIGAPLQRICGKQPSVDGVVRQRRRLLSLFLFGGPRLRPHHSGRHLFPGCPPTRRPCSTASSCYRRRSDAPERSNGSALVVSA